MAVRAAVASALYKTSLSSSIKSAISPSSIRRNSGQNFSTAEVEDDGSPFSGFKMAPPDPIVGLTEAYNNDDFPMKVNVGVGAYRCDEGMPFVLPCVRKAEAILQANDFDHEYSGIAGCFEFVNHALEFVYGDCKPLQEGRIAGVQTLSGTGGLRVMGEVLKKHGHTEIYVPNPTWGNHIPIFTNSGLEVKKYAYYDFENSKLDFANLIADIKMMPKGACILLHVCAHNPTGMDPTFEQWKEISDAVMERGLLPFFDCAYQGFASGDARKDAAPLRLFVEEGHNLALVQSS